MCHLSGGWLPKTQSNNKQELPHWHCQTVVRLLKEPLNFLVPQAAAASTAAVVAAAADILSDGGAHAVAALTSAVTSCSFLS